MPFDKPPYRRDGQCARCGRCCDLYCRHFYWIVNSDVKSGTAITETGIGGPIMSGCLLQNTQSKAAQDLYGGSCVTFPSDPWQTPAKCGYYWTEVDKVEGEGVFWPPVNRA